MTKVREVYQAIIALSQDGQCEIGQPELASRVGISVRQLYRFLQDLKAMNVITIKPVHNRLGHRIKNRYMVLNLTATGSPIGLKPNGHRESDRINLTATGSPIGAKNQPIGLGESEHAMPCHAMPDKLNSKSKKEEIKRVISDLLNFIDEPARSRCAGRLDEAAARAWRLAYDFHNQNDSWSAFGINKNPVGVIIRRIMQGEPPFPLQISLPAASIDLSEFKSRGMTRDEIQAQLGPADGATLGEDGIWR